MRFDGGAIGMTCKTELMAAVEASLGAAPAGTQESQVFVVFRSTDLLDIKYLDFLAN